MHGVDAAVGQTDVIENMGKLPRRNLLANRILDQIAQLGCVLDPRADRAANVQDEFSAIGVGEEVLAQPGDEQEGAGANAEKDRYEEVPPRDQPGEQPPVAVPHVIEAAFKQTLEAGEDIARLRVPVVQPEHVHRQGRNQGSREEVGGEHGEDHRLRQRDKQVASHSREQEHGQEHDADGERRDQRRHRDLRRALENGRLQADVRPRGIARYSQWSPWRRRPGFRPPARDRPGS